MLGSALSGFAKPFSKALRQLVSRSEPQCTCIGTTDRPTYTAIWDFPKT